METVIRSSGRSGRAEEWALVLAAIGIPHRVERSGQRWTLIVPDGEVARACEALEAFDAEQAQSTSRAQAVPAQPAAPWFPGVLVGMLLIAGFSVTGVPVAGSRWFERGAAVAGSIRAEPWRAVTALTLHLDVAHVTGNAVAIAVLLPAIAQRLGAGVGLFVVLGGGGLGNLLAALPQPSGHASVGASTAAFAALGILGALRLRPGFEERTKWKSWTIPAACLVLLTLLGAGRGTDVLAHATGLLSGAAVGLVAAITRQPFGPIVQATLGALTAAIIAACWLRALV